MIELNVFNVVVCFNLNVKPLVVIRVMITSEGVMQISMEGILLNHSYEIRLGQGLSAIHMLECCTFVPNHASFIS